MPQTLSPGGLTFDEVMACLMPAPAPYDLRAACAFDLLDPMHQTLSAYALTYECLDAPEILPSGGMGWGAYVEREDWEPPSHWLHATPPAPPPAYPR